jgi:5-methyltetrahydrofolate--homocysteine methyltransferase
MKSTILESLGARVLVADGGMGTELQRMGLDAGVCGELWNLECPDKVRAVHHAYVAAGAELITTNTFRGNRLALKQHGLESRVAAINHEAAVVARQAAGDKAWVVGSIGPFGGFLEPLGEASVEEVSEGFFEQVIALLEGGVDAILIETMTAVEELKVAIGAARDAGAPVVIATMAFDKVRDGYKTMMGISPGVAAGVAVDTGADVLGCNCGAGLDVRDYVEIVRQLRPGFAGPLLVQPNAGQPELIAGQVIYGMTPHSMAAVVEELVSAGASVIGGCCGTTPQHIREVAEAVRVLQKTR